MIRILISLLFISFSLHMNAQDIIYFDKKGKLSNQQEGYYFRKKGTYTFTISQIMREDPLEHVLNVGLRIEKKQP